MDPLDKICQTIRELVAADARAGNGPSGFSARQAAQSAMRDSFAPRQAYLKQIRIVEVGPDRRIPKHSEEFFRIGTRLYEVHTDALVALDGGPLVRPDAIRLHCRCGAWATEVFFCGYVGCGLGLCRRCVRRLVMPSGQIENLCAAHYQLALDRYNTWEAMDQRGRV